MIQNLIMELVKIGNEYSVKISLHDVLAHEVKNHFFNIWTWTLSNIDILNCVSILTVLVRNLNILWLFKNCITNRCDAANILHKIYAIYDKNSIIECE